jgi:hypothetical protein
VRDELANRNDVLHGGVLMALADNLGGTAATANLPDGANTTTIESGGNNATGFTAGQERSLYQLHQLVTRRAPRRRGIQ